MKKLLYFGDTSIIHTQKWIEYFRNFFDMYVISAQKSKEFDNVTYYYIDDFMKYGKIGYIFSIPKVKQLLHTINPDIMHAHHAMSYGLISAITKKKIPLIITTHGSDILISANKNFINKFFIKYSLKQADIINSVAKHMNEKIMDLGVKKSKIVTLQYGVDMNNFFPITNISKRNKSSVFISTRQFKSVYNHNYLIKIAKKLQEKNINFELWLVGEGTTLSTIKNQVKDLDLSECVKFFGNQNQQEINKLLNLSDYYISTSFSDGTSLCLLESFATKTFPIVSNIPANRELINDKKNGLLLDLNDIDVSTKKILALLTHNDKERVNQLENNFFTVLEKYNQEKNFKYFKKKYITLIKQEKY